jgi:hypothetical protein
MKRLYRQVHFLLRMSQRLTSSIILNLCLLSLSVGHPRRMLLIVRLIVKNLCSVIKLTVKPKQPFFLKPRFIVAATETNKGVTTRKKAERSISRDGCGKRTQKRWANLLQLTLQIVSPPPCTRNMRKNRTLLVHKIFFRSKGSW